MSAQTYNLIDQMPALVALGVEAVRVSPQPLHTAAILERFAVAIAGQPAHCDAGWAEHGWCDGYWHGKAGIENGVHPAPALAD